MSALIRITQGEPDGSADRTTKRTYNFWNTDLDDETLLIERAFVPLARNRANLPITLEKRLDTVMDTFFIKGTFLGESDIQIINDALASINHSAVTLTNNGVYYQPVMTGKRSPDASGWKMNAQSRLAEFEAALDRLPVAPITQLFDGL